MSNFGFRMKHLREFARILKENPDITQSDIALKMGVTKQAVSLFAKNMYELPDEDKFSIFLDKSINPADFMPTDGRVLSRKEKMELYQSISKMNIGESIRVVNCRGKMVNLEAMSRYYAKKFGFIVSCRRDGNDFTVSAIRRITKG